MNVLVLKGTEASAPTTQGAATALSGARLVKFYHTAAATVTVVSAANTVVGNTTLEAGTHFISKNPDELIFATAGLITSVGYSS